MKGPDFRPFILVILWNIHGNFISSAVVMAVSIPALPQMWKSGWKPTAAARAQNTPEEEALWNWSTGKNAVNILLR